VTRRPRQTRRRGKNLSRHGPRPSSRVSAGKVLALFNQDKSDSLTAGEIASRLSLKGKQRGRLGGTLNQLSKTGKLKRIKNRWKLAPEPPRLTGLLEVNPRGFGFLRPDDNSDDIYIPARRLGTALHRDKVAVIPLDSGEWFGRRVRARVVEVLERNTREIIGVLARDGDRLRLIPDNPAYIPPIYLAGGGGKPGDKVAVQVTGWNDPPTEVIARLSEVLGRDQEPAVDTIAVIRSYSLEESHSPEALAEVKEFSSRITPEEIEGREDLRDLTLFTIDPDDARDFDDALSLQVAEDGRQILGVHISDVSHYVRPGSALDREACRRGTSVYFPAKVLHMLPPVLATDLCSLREGVERLAISAFLTFSPEGELLSSRFTPSIINSCRRFTYDEVSRIIEDMDQSARRDAGELTDILDRMAELARLLREKRFRRGALELELPEEKIIFDQEGIISSIELDRGGFSHSLVEEFMLAANEAVAGFLSSRHAPLLYRVHEPPDSKKLREFKDYVSIFGLQPGNLKNSASLRDFLTSVQDTPLGYTVQVAFLRSLRPACYSEKNLGHFGLASDCYAYFTSPIRRYPDLVTHRLLKYAVSSDSFPSGRNTRDLAVNCSDAERRGEGAEREMKALRKLQFFRQNLSQGGGGNFRGVVTEVKKSGLIIYLNKYLISGFLHIRDLPGDRYRFDSSRNILKGHRSGREVSVGDDLIVRVKEVDMRRRSISLVLDE